jgi:hypothetical protein
MEEEYISLAGMTPSLKRTKIAATLSVELISSSTIPLRCREVPSFGLSKLH